MASRARAFYARSVPSHFGTTHLASGERRILVKIKKQIDIIGLYALPQGLLTLGRPKNSADLELELYNLDGHSNSIAMSLAGMPYCMDSVMFQMNPVFNNDDYYYGDYPFTENQRVLTPTLLDVTSGSIISLDEGLLPALMSHGHADTSWRIVFPNHCFGPVGDWTVTDAEGNPITYILFFSISDVSSMKIALSPDGQSIAHLQHTTQYSANTLPITVVTAEGTTELDFMATRIMWGAIDYTFASVFDQG